MVQDEGDVEDAVAAALEAVSAATAAVDAAVSIAIPDAGFESLQGLVVRAASLFGVARTVSVLTCHSVCAVGAAAGAVATHSQSGRLQQRTAGTASPRSELFRSASA